MNVTRARMAFAMRAPALRGAGTPVVPPWTPLNLGASLKEWFHADDTTTGNVAMWTGRIAGIAPTATAGIQPVSAATSFNSAYRGVTGDGVDDCMTATTNISLLPTGSTAGEIWVLASNTIAGSVAAGRTAIAYGDTAPANRQVVRVGTSNINRASVSNGCQTSLSDTVIDVTGPHILSGNWSGTTLGGSVDGRDFTPATAVMASLNTTPTRLRLFAAAGAAASGIWTGTGRQMLITLTLTTLQRQQMAGYLSWDAGLAGSLLPVGHPYKSAAP